MQHRFLHAAVAAAALAVALAAGAVTAADTGKLSGPLPFTNDIPAPPVAAEVTDDIRRMRSYPDQPPVIPHSIRDYQVDLNHNRCLTCHSRTAIERSQAPMISVTHFTNRDGQTLASVSPRRYFCTACHVPQTNAPALVENTFRDAETLITGNVSGTGGGR